MADAPLEQWEQEVLAGHRWQQLGDDTATIEIKQLRGLRAAVGNLSSEQQSILAQVIGPEICNWALFETISRVCSIIGSGEPDTKGTGHLATVTPERWRKIWAYYLACRQWLVERARPRASYQLMLKLCDPQGSILHHVERLLGQRDSLKEFWVERFCVCLEAWLDDLPPQGQPRKMTLEVAACSLEKRILKEEPQPRVPFDMIRLDDCSILQPCHHKLFRRYDIILSSIGDGQWRKSMPVRGSDGLDRADKLQPYLAALDQWLATDQPTAAAPPAGDLYARLGRPDSFKRFAVALLVSILRAQQISARRKAMKHLEASSAASNERAADAQ